VKYETTLTLPGGQWTITIEDDTLTSCRHGVRLEGLPTVPPEHPILRALHAYAGGEVQAIDDIEVAQPGGEFHTLAREAMRRIPPGRTVSYAELAAMAGRPAAARAAAGACARNQVAVVVPCHRVVRGDGGLGGYAYGLDVKEALLAFEREQAG
jgi:methylated-DNA--[protein]-cysteine S-methyltransferase